VGASFPAATTGSSLSFTATAIDDAMLGGQPVLSGWQFSTDYAVSSSQPAYLSLLVGAGQSLKSLALWQYDDGEWGRVAANDWTYDGQYVSFTAGELGGYALTAVPEPGMLMLAAVGLIGFAAYARRRRA
jgi:hypothetical protein